MSVGKTKKQGFTIIELLVVITVIGVLAAIMAVSYTGIQTKAKNTVIEQGVENYKKILDLYYAQNGTYPVTGSSVCLGNATTLPNGCWVGSVDATFMSGLATVSASVSDFDDSCHYMYGDCRRNAVLFYSDTATIDGKAHHYYIVYFLDDNGDCNLAGNLQSPWLSFQSVGPSKYMERYNGVSMCVIPVADPV